MMTESEKLYCAMLHLACFVDDMKNGRIANPVSMCERCRIFESSGCTGNLFYENVGSMAESVGVRIGPFTAPAEYQVHLDK